MRVKYLCLLLAMSLLAACQPADKAQKDAGDGKAVSAPATQNYNESPAHLASLKARAANRFSWRNATIYFLLTDRFYNQDSTNDVTLQRTANTAVGRGFMGGDLKGITHKIKQGYFNSLGVNALWLTPVVEQIYGATNEGTGNTYGYHGYWAKDWTALDPNFGTAQDLKALVAAAHARGIRVIMDVVLNHIGPVTDQDPAYGNDWVRTEPACTYQDYETTVTCTLVKNLPDVRTDSDAAVELPPMLVEKWKAEGRYEQEVQELDAFFERTGYPRAPRYYIIKWLVDFIKEYGVDAFRIDTAKHVEASVWDDLYKEAMAAYEQWKQDNPEARIDNEPFYTLGEVYGYAIQHEKDFPMGGGRTVDFYSNGVNALINFAFKGDANKSAEELFSTYANYLHNSSLADYSVVNYISSHDDGGPFDKKRERPMEAATKLMLCPGAVQIYYGDETSRVLEVAGAEGDANLRSFMNWNELEGNATRNGFAVQDVQAHWAKLGQFRTEHPAVGAGIHEKLADSPYTFGRSFSVNGVEDNVVVVMGTPTGPIPVSSYFADGTEVKDYYSGQTATVSNGTVSFETTANLVLIGIDYFAQAPAQ